MRKVLKKFSSANSVALEEDSSLLEQFAIACVCSSEIVDSSRKIK